MRITNIPGKAPTKLIDFQRLDGGLNLWELDYRLKGNQSPEMKNLWWQDGVLQCRDGQEYVYGPTLEQMQDPLPEGVEAWVDLGTGYTCASEVFWDNAFFHIQDKLYRMDMTADTKELVEVASGVSLVRGTFFRYNEYLYYKTTGSFFKISHDPDAAELFTAVDVSVEAYVPTILLNADPATGAGDTYQPENRLSPQKEVHYNAAETTDVVYKTGDGSTKTFSLGKTAAADFLTGIEEIYLGNTLISNTLYTVDLEAGSVTFSAPPDNEATVSFVLKFGVVSYQLPVKEIDSVVSVIVDGTGLTEGTDYAVNLEDGTVVFVTPPPVHNPAVNNTVEITYSKANPDALQAIMDCPYATVYGGSESKVCLVLGGSVKQPNAFFWNGNDDVGMNDTYWPMPFYQLAGDAKDGVTGFGVQYGTLLVLKEKSIGRSVFSVESVDDRDSILLTYEEINGKIGCDLPWTIQLIENNVVFCNTVGGVHLVRESTSALENNIESISRNVNGTEMRPGLLLATRGVARDDVCAFDDDNRYWLCAGGKVYLWDYLLSSWKDPSWFYFENVPGIAYFRHVDKSYHLDSSGRVTQFARVFLDYDSAIEKVYRFPPQFFDTYDRLKDVLTVVLAVRSDTDSEVSILYQSDYEDRNDLEPILSYSWRLFPRNLTYRFLGVQRFAHVARRAPKCLHVRHFSMQLSNNIPAQDLAIISAQIYFRYTGRDR